MILKSFFFQRRYECVDNDCVAAVRLSTDANLSRPLAKSLGDTYKLLAFF